MRQNSSCINSAVILLMCISLPTYCLESPLYAWVEAGLGHGKSAFGDVSANLSLNAGYKKFTAKIDFRQHSQGLDILGDNYYEYGTGKEIEEGVKERNVLVGYSIYNDWYRLTGSIGVGFMTAETKKDCAIVKGSDEFFGGDDFLCTRNASHSLSLPINATLMFGKYLGIGIQGNASFSTDNNMYSVGFIIPLGSFN